VVNKEDDITKIILRIWHSKKEKIMDYLKKRRELKCDIKKETKEEITST